MCPFGKSALEILKTGRGRPDLSDLRAVTEISDLAKERWIMPRSLRRPEYRNWRRNNIPDLVYGKMPVGPVRVHQAV